MESRLVVATGNREQLKQLRAELDEARIELNAAEAALANEQAAVNRFRMHCRLKIGNWVDDVLRQRAERQHLLTKLTLMRQSAEFNIPFDEDDPYWEAHAEAFPSGNSNANSDDSVLLPTDVPSDKAAEKRLYRELAKRFHPDLAAAGMERAYATTMMAAINEAYQAGDRVRLRNLAGEMPPEEMQKFQGGATREERKLRKSLLGCKRRLRKVTEQFNAMKQENTAKLWRKAKALDAEFSRAKSDADSIERLNWWDAVRVELETESKRLAQQIETLSAQVDKFTPAEPT